MTILLTDDQAAKVRERLEYIDSQWFAECITLLDGAQRVEVVGWTNPAHDYFAPLRKDTVFGSHTLPLYAMKETK
jgi:hypothetical protein